jgi:hypothetical protein
VKLGEIVKLSLGVPGMGCGLWGVCVSKKKKKKKKKTHTPSEGHVRFENQGICVFVFCGFHSSKKIEWVAPYPPSTYKMEDEQVLFTITDDELVLEPIDEFEIMLATGYTDMRFCNMCGEDTNEVDAYHEYRSFFDKSTLLCMDCLMYHIEFRRDSDRWKDEHQETT